MDVLWIVLSGVAGLAIGSGCMVGLSKAGLNKNQQKAEQILKEAQNEAESRVKQAVLDGKTQAHDLRVEAEKEIKERKQESMELENKLLRREDNLNFRDEALNQKERQINEKMKSVADKLTSLDEKEKKLQEEIDKQVVVLESVAKMSSQAAKDELFAIVEKKMEHETIAYIKDKEDEAKATANEKAQNIIALAIERMSQQETQEKTVSVVSLPGEEMKGRIIGREGRNIRCFEQATGVELNIDDTPDLITITCFNPVRREVARLALEHLIRDGRIQPGRIEDVVKKYQNEIDQEIMKAGEEAIFKLGIGRIDREIVKLIGTLKYRYSYGQNALQHSMEVAYIAGCMAAELGLNQQIAKRAGLLHDIGKALNIEQQDGSHVDFYKFGIQLITACHKWYIHKRTVFLSYRTFEQFALIQVIIEQFGFLFVAFFHNFQSAHLFEPFKYLTADIDSVCRRCIVKRTCVCMCLVCKHSRCSRKYILCNQIFTDDRDNNTRWSDILLDSAIDETIFCHIYRLRQEAG